nr:MAG TPA: hypothetical protein [Caudoviricetes sp.]
MFLSFNRNFIRLFILKYCITFIPCKVRLYITNKSKIKELYY